MEQTRVPKGEKYWYIGNDWQGKIVAYSTKDVNMVEDRTASGYITILSPKKKHYL